MSERPDLSSMAPMVRTKAPGRRYKGGESLVHYRSRNAIVVIDPDATPAPDKGPSNFGLNKPTGHETTAMLESIVRFKGRMPYAPEARETFIALIPEAYRRQG